MAAGPRILLVRLSAFGDVVHGLPALCALRDAMPQAFIAWAVEERFRALLEGHGDLDLLVTLPRPSLRPGQLLPTLGAARRVAARLRGLAFDIAIDLQGLLKSAAVARLSGAPRRIGFGGRDGRELSRALQTETVIPRALHVIERTLELLRPLGIERPSVRFRVPAPAGAAERAAAALREAGLTGDFALLHPGAGWESKRWPADRFAALARMLGERHGLAAALCWAGPAEHALATGIAAAAGAAARPLPPLALDELAAVARRARLFVAGDTGPLHLAAAVGTPCIGLYGPTAAARNGPYGEGHVVLQAAGFATGGSAMRRDAGEAIRAIPLEAVIAACEAVLGRPEARRLSGEEAPPIIPGATGEERP